MNDPAALPDPLDEQAVARLLGEARVTTGLPAEVAARLDATLAGLHHEAATPARTRHSRRWAVAGTAAAVLLGIGVGVGVYLPRGGASSDSAARSDVSQADDRRAMTHADQPPDQAAAEATDDAERDAASPAPSTFDADALQSDGASGEAPSDDPSRTSTKKQIELTSALPAVERDDLARGLVPLLPAVEDDARADGAAAAQRELLRCHVPRSEPSGDHHRWVEVSLDGVPRGIRVEPGPETTLLVAIYDCRTGQLVERTTIDTDVG